MTWAMGLDLHRRTARRAHDDLRQTCKRFMHGPTEVRQRCEAAISYWNGWTLMRRQGHLTLLQIAG